MYTISYCKVIICWESRCREKTCVECRKSCIVFSDHSLILWSEVVLHVGGGCIACLGTCFRALVGGQALLGLLLHVGPYRFLSGIIDYYVNVWRLFDRHIFLLTISIHVEKAANVWVIYQYFDCSSTFDERARDPHNKSLSRVTECREDTISRHNLYSKG